MHGMNNLKLQTCLRAMLSPQFGVSNIYVKSKITAAPPPQKAADLTSSKWKYVGSFEKDRLFV
jgi:hypothetical protein